MNLVTKHKKDAEKKLVGIVNNPETFSGVITPRAENGDLFLLQYFKGELIGAMLIPDEQYVNFIRAVMTAVPAPKKESNDTGTGIESNPS